MSSLIQSDVDHTVQFRELPGSNIYMHHRAERVHVFKGSWSGSLIEAKHTNRNPTWFCVIYADFVAVQFALPFTRQG